MGAGHQEDQALWCCHCIGKESSVKDEAAMVMSELTFEVVFSA